MKLIITGTQFAARQSGFKCSPANPAIIKSYCKGVFS